MTRVVVIGAGVSGLVAAIRLARAGASVSLLAKGTGGLQLSQGTADILGYAPERVERIFEPFYQVDGSPTRAHGGVGVGLAIARRVARGLGGDVKLLPDGATIEGMFLGGAAFSITVAKRAPTVVVEPA